MEKKEFTQLQTEYRVYPLKGGVKKVKTAHNNQTGQLASDNNNQTGQLANRVDSSQFDSSQIDTENNVNVNVDSTENDVNVDTTENVDSTQNGFHDVEQEIQQLIDLKAKYLSDANISEADAVGKRIESLYLSTKRIVESGVVVSVVDKDGFHGYPYVPGHFGATVDERRYYRRPVTKYQLRNFNNCDFQCGGKEECGKESAVNHDHPSSSLHPAALANVIEKATETWDLLDKYPDADAYYEALHSGVLGLETDYVKEGLEEEVTNHGLEEELTNSGSDNIGSGQNISSGPKNNCKLNTTGLFPGFFLQARENIKKERLAEFLRECDKLEKEGKSVNDAIAGANKKVKFLEDRLIPAESLPMKRKMRE
jgi:hypothetical protein